MINVELVVMPLMEVGGAEGTVHGCVQRNKIYTKSKLDTSPSYMYMQMCTQILYKIFSDIHVIIMMLLAFSITHHLLV